MHAVGNLLVFRLLGFFFLSFHSFASSPNSFSILSTSTSILRYYCGHLYYFYHNYATLPYCLKFGRTSTKFTVYANLIIQNTCLGASKCIPNGLVCCNCSFISIAICALCLHNGDLFLQMTGKPHKIIKNDK